MSGELIYVLMLFVLCFMIMSVWFYQQNYIYMKRSAKMEQAMAERRKIINNITSIYTKSDDRSRKLLAFTAVTLNMHVDCLMEECDVHSLYKNEFVGLF